MNKLWNASGRTIHLQEVVMRDGMLVEEAFVPTVSKIELVNALSQSGMAKIEAAAFVSPQAIPALRDAETVLREIERVPGVTYSALVPDERGAERAIDARADEFNLVMSASESHNQAHLRKTREQSFNALSDVNALARQAHVAVNLSLSCSFGCPMEGDVPAATVLALCSQFVEKMGARGVTLCDTTGMARPRQVFELTRAFRARWPEAQLSLHFHDTQGLGLVNILAAISGGADRFDASLSGIDSSTHVRSAIENLHSDDIVHALELMGFDTGVDVKRLLDAATLLPAMVGHLQLRFHRARRRLKFNTVLAADFDAIRLRALARDA